MSKVCLTRREFLEASAAAVATGGVRGCGPLQAADSKRYDLPSGTERVCLSLRVLERRADNAVFLHTRLPQDVASLGGIGYLEGYYVDPAGQGDLVLIGRRSKRPALHLDDLIANLRNISVADKYPLCSLDPIPENVRRLQNLLATASFTSARSAAESIRQTMGPQRVVVDGVPRNSRHAHIMVDADYHMKKVSQGQIRLSGVISYLELVLRKAAAGGSSMARFWFHVARNAPLFEEEDDTVWLEKCRVVLLTEKQVATSSGMLHDVQDDDPNATAFADAMSKELPELTKTVPVYAKLVNLYRLRALLLAMRTRGAFKAAHLNTDRFLRRYKPYCDKTMPDSLPALANHRSSRSGHAAVVCGGVGMDMSVVEQSFRKSSGVFLSRLRREALRRRPSRNAMTWVLTPLT